MFLPELGACLPWYQQYEISSTGSGFGYRQPSRSDLCFNERITLLTPHRPKQKAFTDKPQISALVMHQSITQIDHPHIDLPVTLRSFRKTTCQPLDLRPLADQEERA